MTATDAITPAADASAPEAGEDGRRDRSGFLALAVFVAAEIVAFGLWLYLGRHEWFRVDDWSFLAGRSAFDLHDLFADHQTHWKTLEIVVYRAMWWAFGIRSYIPYMALAIIGHLVVAALLRVVMRRAGVNPWIATAAATLFVFFGAGYGNIVWAFQMGLDAAVALGLTQIMLADHDGPLDRRDALGVVAGVGAVMCAGVGVAMVAAAAGAALMRRGWRAALLHGGVPAVAYLTWWAAIGRRGFTRREAPFGAVLDFIRVGVHHTFGSLGQVPGVGLVLGALLLAGLALAWVPLDRAARRRQAAVPVALMGGALVYLLISAIGRVHSRGIERALATHYRHVVAALALPALAIACDAFARRWKVLTPILCALLLVGIPGNIEALADYTREIAPKHRSERQLILSLPRTEAAQSAPRDATPHGYAKVITLGWLMDGAASGRIPRPSKITAEDEAIARFRFLFLQSIREEDGATGDECLRLTEPVRRHFERGDTISFGNAGVRIKPVPGDAPARAAKMYRLNTGRLLTALGDSFDVVLASPGPDSTSTVCFGES